MGQDLNKLSVFQMTWRNLPLQSLERDYGMRRTSLQILSSHGRQRLIMLSCWVKWDVRTNAPSDLTIILPLLEPDWPRLKPERQSITPEMLLQMNSYLESLSEGNLANVALSFKDMLSTAAPEITHDQEGLHLVDKVTSAQAQLLLNLRCNDILPKKFPFDSTCCSKYPLPNYQQLTLLRHRSPCHSSSYIQFTSVDLLHKSYIPSESVLQALLAFGLVLVYTFFTDRTHLFGKEAKHFSLEQFWFLVVLTGIIGYLTAETADKDQPFLSRDQTDEWKGWMQILILIYHYLGASKVSWIYNGIRVLVAMYLFMTGFGHTVFFYRKADYSFKRVVAVMVRLNLLNVVLAYTMNTDYLFYYFSPLVSFWFGVIWITMWIKHDRNKDMGFLGTKFGISAMVVTIFTKTPGILETVFSVLKTVANINWDAVEWRFRVGLDMWIVYIGMIVAIVFIKASDFQSSPNWQNYRSIALRLINRNNPNILSIRSNSRKQIHLQSLASLHLTFPNPRIHRITKCVDYVFEILIQQPLHSSVDVLSKLLFYNFIFGWQGIQRGY